jgi:hypothetical protein
LHSYFAYATQAGDGWAGRDRLARAAAPDVVATQDPRPWIPEITQ